MKKLLEDMKKNNYCVEVVTIIRLRLGDKYKKEKEITDLSNFDQNISKYISTNHALTMTNNCGGLG